MQIARARAFPGGVPPYPPQLSTEQKEQALREAAQQACRFCATIHPGASSPACPRLATFKLNGDFEVIEGSFWPDGVSETVTGLDGNGNVVSVTQRTRSEWDTSRVVAPADLAEEEDEGNGDSD